MATLDDELDAHDWYGILDLPITATDADINKAYRNLARTQHPDRNKDDPDAAAKFHLIQRASQLLLNPTLRSAYDAKVQARLLRKKRDREASITIQSMKIDLLAREQAAAEELRREKGEKYFKDTMMKYRTEAAQLKDQYANKTAQKLKKQQHEFTDVPPAFVTTVELFWDPKIHKYAENDIKKMIEPFEKVPAAIVRAPGQAYVLFSNADYAMKAISQLNPSSELSQRFGILKASLLGMDNYSTTNSSQNEFPVDSSTASSSADSSSKYQPQKQTYDINSSVRVDNDEDEDDELFVLQKMKSRSAPKT